MAIVSVIKCEQSHAGMYSSDTCAQINHVKITFPKTMKINYYKVLTMFFKINKGIKTNYRKPGMIKRFGLQLHESPLVPGSCGQA